MQTTGYDAEVQRRERAEEEVDSAHMFLDDEGVPKGDSKGTYSLVGRIAVYGEKCTARYRNNAHGYDHLMDLIEELSGVPDCSLAMAQQIIRAALSRREGSGDPQ